MFIHIIQANYIEGYKIWLKFDNGTTGEVDLENQLWGEIFEPLKDKNFFKQLELDEIAGTVIWKNGADFAPEFLYELCNKT